MANTDFTPLLSPVLSLANTKRKDGCHEALHISLKCIDRSTFKEMSKDKLVVSQISH